MHQKSPLNGWMRKLRSKTIIRDPADSHGLLRSSKSHNWDQSLMFMTIGKSSSKTLTLVGPMELTSLKVLISIVWFFMWEFPSWVLSSIHHCSSFTSLIFSATTQTLETFSLPLPSASRVFCTSVLWVLRSCLFSVQLLSATT